MAADPADLAATSPSATEETVEEAAGTVVVESVPEGKIVDFVTGKLMKDTPEEYVRQNIEKALVKQYRYPAGDCEPEFRINSGSSRPRVDIVIFEPSAEHKQENAYVLVETKKPGSSPTAKKDGIGSCSRICRHV
jgi:type I restriction enzyme M protein